MNKSRIALAGMLLFAATASMAMSLGRNRGAVLLGRPLDISVQAVLDTQDDAASLCLEADVYYADNRIPRVRVSADPVAAGSRDTVIRIRSDSLIDEPVVTVYLRAGCQQRSEKRFVMLADLVTEGAAQPVPGAALPVVPAQPAAVPPTAAARPPSDAAGNAAAEARAASRARARAAAPAAAAAPAGGAAPVVAATPASAAARPARAAPAAKAAEKTAKAKLKLEPLDLTIERDPQLRASAEMLSMPAANEQERAVAAALWRALSAQPQDILKDAERLQSLDASVRELRSQTLKNQQAIADLNNQLQQAKAERYANLLVYGLGVLLLLALVALAWFWRQRSLSGDADGNELPWWRKNRALDKGWANSLHEVESAPPRSGLPASASQPAKAGKPAKHAKATPSELDLDLGIDSAGHTEVKHLSGHGAESLPPLSRRDRADFAVSMTTPSRAVKAEELFDVQQQADFFVSLGQHEQAIEVLRSHIADNGPTSALVYLDLFNLYHQLGRREDYEALRGEFNQLFNATIPPFDLYSVASPGLESYEAAMTRIEALWPSPKVLDIIEESIFRKPDGNSKAFDLEAYRELLLLYAVAREIISPEDNKNDSLLSFDLPDSTLGGVEAKAVKFASTAIQPLSASVAEDNHGETQPISVSAFPRPSPRLGLDIDLSTLVGEGDPPGSETESDSHFFAQFVANLPGNDAVPDLAAPTTQPPKPVEDLGNLIDFDSFDSGGFINPKKPPQA